MKNLLLAAAAALALTAGPALAADELNDLEIAHAAYTAGQIDVETAQLALEKSDTPEIRAFAETMIRDHKAVNEAALALLAELDVQPQDNAVSQSLLDQAAETRETLSGLEGGAFDESYAEHELAYHQTVNTVLETQFIPWADNERLRGLLEQALATFRVHEGHAEALVNGS